MSQLIKKIIDSIIYIESFFHSRAKMGKKRRILIFRKDGLGDCILFYPLLESYRKFYSRDEITLILPRWFEPFSPLLDKYNFENIIWFDHKKFRKSFPYRRNFLLNLKKQRFDIVIYPVYTRENIGEFMIKLTKAHELKVNIPTDMISEIDRNKYYAEQITGQKILVSFPTIKTSDLSSNDDHLKSILEQNELYTRPFVIIFPGAGAPYRIWPTERWAEVIDYIANKNVVPVICGSPNEIKLAEKIISLTKSSSKIVNLVGKTNLPALTLLLDKARFYFGSDTGVLHIAVAVGTPTIALMGIGGYRRFFPYSNIDKNRAIFSAEYMKINSNKIGSWDSAKSLKTGEIHPSIFAITSEMAKHEINYMIQYLNLNEENN